MDRGGGQVVRVPTFNSDDPSSNPAAEVCSFSVQFVFEKNKKRPVLSHYYFLNKSQICGFKLKDFGH